MHRTMSRAKSLYLIIWAIIYHMSRPHTKHVSNSIFDVSSKISKIIINRTIDRVLCFRALEELAFYIEFLRIFQWVPRWDKQTQCSWHHCSFGTHADWRKKCDRKLQDRRQCRRKFNRILVLRDILEWQCRCWKKEREKTQRGVQYVD